MSTCTWYNHRMIFISSLCCCSPAFLKWNHIAIITGKNKLRYSRHHEHLWRQNSLRRAKHDHRWNPNKLLRPPCRQKTPLILTVSQTLLVENHLFGGDDFVFGVSLSLQRFSFLLFISRWQLVAEEAHDPPGLVAQSYVVCEAGGAAWLPWSHLPLTEAPDSQRPTWERHLIPGHIAYCAVMFYELSS